MDRLSTFIYRIAFNEAGAIAPDTRRRLKRNLNTLQTFNEAGAIAPDTQIVRSGAADIRNTFNEAGAIAPDTQLSSGIAVNDEGPSMRPAQLRRIHPSPVRV